MSERELITKIQKYIKAKYPDAVVYKFSDRFTVGIPDLAILINSKTYWIEVKKGEAETRTMHAKRQIAELARIAATGNTACMVYDMAQVRCIL